jgi:hypothetical protein
MTEAIGQPGGAALPHPMGVGEILSTAFQLYRRFPRHSGPRLGQPRVL